jgi:hypothetical protein
MAVRDAQSATASTQNTWQHTACASRGTHAQPHRPCSIAPAPACAGRNISTNTCLTAAAHTAATAQSFLMNQLARRRDVFRISNAKDPCTVGVDLSRAVLPLAEFKAGAAATGRGGGGAQAPKVRA